ncbi:MULTISPECIES: TetR/AcrR family transcriptional regulator [unclassified Pseudonocardia]|uniref:TetR/AcrR family transcriptional regulator n=1 Tax=unclassified Pseudonocardia TaxID=2619320 RepID=UPI000968603D|nr:TetR/AcrR family transcriptional regulator [Pseudonocardia sp. Ae707_Ps1]OLM09259.1 Transcriptional regulator, TetR family [Pseudonocardia sp. Ae707_Ps1]
MTHAATDGRVTRARRREAARSRLLEVVERRLRAGETFADIKVGEIVTEAGLSRTTFYVYFEDKADLLRAWYDDVSLEIMGAAERWWTLGADLERPDLRSALAAIVAAYRPHPELMAATHEAIGYDQDVRHSVNSAMENYIAGLAGHIERGQAEGFVDPALPPHDTAYWLQWMAERGLHRMVRSESAARTESLLDAYSMVVWNTLYAPARR